MIALVDYDAGNLHSVLKAAQTTGLDVLRTSDPRHIAAADAVILPGVGSFPACMRRLEGVGLLSPLREHIAAGRPFLGICLGLQLLFEWGDEAGGAPGLGVLPGRVRGIDAPALKVPHMGWNALRFTRRTPLFDGIEEGEYFYFVHSFHAVPADAADLVATVEYGDAVTAAVARGAVHAVQFHPEKSSRAGLRLLGNFGRIVTGGAR